MVVMTVPSAMIQVTAVIIQVIMTDPAAVILTTALGSVVTATITAVVTAAVTAAAMKQMTMGTSMIKSITNQAIAQTQTQTLIKVRT